MPENTQQAETLFPELQPIALAESEPVEKLSADRRRTLRQRGDVERGRHPLTGSKLYPRADARCGSCRFREVWKHHNRSYAKCVFVPASWSAERYESNPPPRVTHSAASDVRAWWPGCTDWELGDPRVSSDAARWSPDSDSSAVVS